MIAMPHTRRSAEEFARAVEGGLYHDREITGLLDLAEGLVDLGRAVPGPSPAFRESLRQHLHTVGAELDAQLDAAGLDTAGRAASARATHRSRQSRRSRPRPATTFPSAAVRRRLAIAGFAVGAVAGGAAGTAMAAEDALPGDALYGVKRTVEEVQLALAGSDEAKGQRYLDIAETRLDEVSKLVERPAANADAESIERISRTFGDLRKSTQQGRELLLAAYGETGDPGRLAALLDFVESQRSEVAALQPEVPVELQREPEAMMDLLEQITTEVLNLDPNAGSRAEQDQPADVNALPDREVANPTGTNGPSAAKDPVGAAASGSVTGGATGATSAEPGVSIGVNAGSSPSVGASAKPGLPLPNVNVTLLGITINLGLGD